MGKGTFSDIKSSRLYCTLSSSFIGVLVIVGCLLLFAAIMTKVDVPEGVMSAMSVFALCVGAFSGAYIASRKHRHNGMIIGILTGVIIYSLILIVGIIFAKSSVNFGLFSKLVITLICGAIGGIIGVNSRQKRY